MHLNNTVGYFANFSWNVMFDEFHRTEFTFTNIYS